MRNRPPQLDFSERLLIALILISVVALALSVSPSSADTLRWEPGEGDGDPVVTWQVVVLAGDGAVVTEVPAAETELEIEIEGRYSWTVCALDADGERACATTQRMKTGVYKPAPAFSYANPACRTDLDDSGNTLMGDFGVVMGQLNVACAVPTTPELLP